MRTLAEEVRAGHRDHARAKHAKYGEIYAYEVDGFGNQLLDGRCQCPEPALPALSGLRAKWTTRSTNARGRWCLSEDNPYFYRGAAGEGLGGPHSGLGMIWPLGIITRALTSTMRGRSPPCLAMLKATHAGTGFMHESFSRTDATRYTRKWFAWANTLFGELMLKVYRA